MDEKMLDLQNLLILCGSHKTIEGSEGYKGLNNDTFDIMLREYAREVDRINGFYSNYNPIRSLRFKKVQGYDVTLNISHS